MFLLHDMRHCLSPHALPPTESQFAVRAGAMTPLDAQTEMLSATPGRIGLACGFFEFRSDLGDSLRALLPEYIIARHDDTSLVGASAVFRLIREEAIRTGDTPSPLINRLTDVLFFYALRAVASAEDVALGLWAVMRKAEFAPLINAIIEEPGGAWTTNSMATFCHMSRAKFCRQFVDVCGYPPAQFLALLRMKVAAEMLRQGSPTSEAAEHVGYQSESAFAHAFKRVTGLQPGACRKERSDSPAYAGEVSGPPMH
ncbi:AraC family transcriptional regulator [Paraburkholderia hospita]|uniref:AraC family transcriptional regulator n=1 Tax=Paraburkholderia hospita TaxID=169430 RepID=A0ABP2PWS4_9BURK|nr:AraC family transcriptional regulator [Paraburkholderia hospita]